jgi:hypothetical protein
VGRVRPATVEVPFEDRKEISATLRYLLGTHGTRAIAPWFQDVLAASDTLASGERPSRRLDERVRRLVAHLNVPYVGRGESGTPRYYRYTADLRGTTVPVTGYDVLLWVSDRREGAGPLAEFRTVHGRQGRALDVMRGAELLTSLPLDTLVMGLRANAGDGARQREVPADSLRLERESPLAHVVLYVEAITGEAGRDSLAVRGVSGVVLVKLK